MSAIIRAAIAAQGVSQREAAERIGISASHLSNLLAGQDTITQRIASRLEAALGVSAHTVLAEQPRLLKYDRRQSLQVRAGGKFDCTSLCLGGGRCVLDADVYHVLHICSDSECECHSRFRYEPKTTEITQRRLERRQRAKNELPHVTLSMTCLNRQKSALETIARGRP